MVAGHKVVFQVCVNLFVALEPRVVDMTLKTLKQYHRVISSVRAHMTNTKLDALDIIVAHHTLAVRNTSILTPQTISSSFRINFKASTSIVIPGKS